MQVVKDPQGAAFAIYEPVVTAAGSGRPAAIGDISWHELYTTDNVAAMAFYGDLFGWKPTEAMDMGPMGVYRMFGRRGPGQSMGGMMTKTPDMAHIPNAGCRTSWCPTCTPPPSASRRTAERCVMGPTEVPGGSWILQGQDPQGATFALHHLKR